MRKKTFFRLVDASKPHISNAANAAQKINVHMQKKYANTASNFFAQKSLS